ncbi:MAG: trypco2 family protein [Pseudonocardiaceae bacterium]
MAERAELAQVIGQLRQEFTAVMRDGEGADLRFELGPVVLGTDRRGESGSGTEREGAVLGDRADLTHRGVVPGQVAEIIVTLDGGAGRRGLGIPGQADHGADSDARRR